MRTPVVQALSHRRAEIRARWIELLFVEPVNSPLANPNTLIFLIDTTLDDVMAALQRGRTPPAMELPEARSSHNPYLAYFRAGIQALHEALILIQAAAPQLDPRERDAAFAELDTVIRQIACQEIATFEALCRAPSREKADVVP